MLLFILFFILPLPLLIWLFIRSKTRKAKWIISAAMVLFIAFLSFTALGLWGMDVEDLYGDDQEIFWEASSGDTVKLVDSYNKEIIATAILKKTWHRIHVMDGNHELDIRQWIEDEIGGYFIETQNEIKKGVVTIIVLHPQDDAYFIGAYLDPYTLEIKWIGENLIRYQITSFEEKGQQMGTIEQGLAKLQPSKKDTLIYKNSINGNNLIISVWGKKGSRKAKIFRKGDGKKAHFEALNYNKFWEK